MVLIRLISLDTIILQFILKCITSNSSIMIVGKINKIQFQLQGAINYLNIGLMLLSLVAAYIIPFELFLFSYAVLGPLHYLTEISWLDKKNFFVKSKTDIVLLVLLVLLVSIAKFDNKSSANLFYTNFVFLAFAYALMVLFVNDTQTKIIFSVGIFLVTVLLGFNNYNGLPFLLFAVWLPTIIHVYVFTGIFICFGALKSRSVSGLLSVLVFLLCGVIFFLFTPDNIGMPITNYGKGAYSFFSFINISLYKLFGFGILKKTDNLLYTAPKALAVMRFIAFSYTYHYLNWFSKTSVIKWNEVSKRRMVVILVCWIAAVLLYAISYKVGFYALFLLSMLHVFLEFPLNHQTFIGVGKELSSMFNKRSTQ